MSIEDIKPPSPHLSRLGMLPRYSAVLTAVAYQEIERIVKEEVGKGWEVRRLPRIRQRVAVGLVNWIASCFESELDTALRFCEPSPRRYGQRAES
jgi:anaphase-promoting complex subunit 2